MKQVLRTGRHGLASMMRRGGRTHDRSDQRHHRRLVLAATVLFLWLSPPTWAAVVGAHCDDWRYRHGRADFDLYDDTELAAVAGRARTVTIPWLPSTYEGFTLPGLIVTSQPDNGKHRHHELVHARQWEERGVLRQGWHYLYEWHIGRLHGCSAHDAYMSIAAEQQARAHEPQRLVRLVEVVQTQIIADQLGRALGHTADADEEPPSPDTVDSGTPDP